MTVALAKRRMVLAAMAIAVSVAAWPPNAAADGFRLIAGNLSDGVYDFSLEDNLAYLACGRDGLQIFDVGDPASPTLLGAYPTSGSARGLAVSGTRVYVSWQPENPYAYPPQGDSGFLVIDATDPASPALVGFFESASPRLGAAAVVGRYLYVADNVSLCYGGPAVFDLDDPWSPRYVGLPNTQGLVMGHVYTMRLQNDSLFMATDAGLEILNVSHPHVPWLRGYSIDTCGGRDIDLYYGLAYVADVRGLRLISVRDPVSPKQVGRFLIPDGAQGVCVVGRLAFVATTNGEILALDTRDPSAPVVLGSYDTGGQPGRMVVSNYLLYIADYVNGLTILEYTGPRGPAPARHWNRYH